MNYILFDEKQTREQLLPLTFTRPVCGIRIGILTIAEKWERYLGKPVSYHTEAYLQGKFPKTGEHEVLYINGKICPTAALAALVMNLAPDTGLATATDLVAYRYSKQPDTFSEAEAFESSRHIKESYLAVNHPWDIFSLNGEAISQDFELLTNGRKSAPLSNTNTVIGDESLVFLEEGAIVEASVINTKSGPVYIGRDAEVMELSAIRGPFALCDHSTLKLSAKIYGPTTIGPHCKVGGELNNTVVFGYSNKAHDGFLGNSVIGEWCNLGADTNNSNLKNNYANVKLYSYVTNRQEDTGLQFCGLVMGDHSKCGINTMFNTGTVVGVGANIFGGDFPPAHVPSFSWGGASGFETYRPDKMFETTGRVLARRNMVLSAGEKEILSEIFERTKHLRTW